MIPQITSCNALNYEIMERDERIQKACNAFRSIYQKGYDPTDYIDSVLKLYNVDWELSQSELDKINHCL